MLGHAGYISSTVPPCHLYTCDCSFYGFLSAGLAAFLDGSVLSANLHSKPRLHVAVPNIQGPVSRAEYSAPRLQGRIKARRPECSMLSHKCNDCKCYPLPSHRHPNRMAQVQGFTNLSCVQTYAPRVRSYILIWGTFMIHLTPIWLYGASIKLLEWKTDKYLQNPPQ